MRQKDHIKAQKDHIKAKMEAPWGGWGGRLAARRGVIVKLLVAAKVGMEMVPSAELAIRSDRARCRGQSVYRLRRWTQI